MFSSWVIFPFFTMLTSSEWSWLIFYMFAGLTSLLPTAKNYFPLLRLIIYMKLKIGWWINWLVFLFLLFLYLISKLLISFMFLTILYTRIWERNNNYILLYHFEPFRPPSQIIHMGIKEDYYLISKTTSRSWHWSSPHSWNLKHVLCMGP